LLSGEFKLSIRGGCVRFKTGMGKHLLVAVAKESNQLERRGQLQVLLSHRELSGICYRPDKK
jgi:hypothetical protein